MLNIIDAALDIINLLSRPITTYVNSKGSSIYKLWIKYNIELFNSQTEFLSLGKLSFVEDNMFNNTFSQNYKAFKSSINFSKGTHRVVPAPYENKNCYINLEKAMLDCYDIHDRDQMFTDEQKEKLQHVKDCIDRCVKYEKNYYQVNKRSSMLLVTLVYQYLNEFENKSININMWNYSLRTMQTSRKYLYLGFITIFSQISWLSILSYNIISDWNPNYDTLILTIAVLSSLISVLYSYDTIHSFSNSCSFYSFTNQLYTDFPKLNGNKNILKWNFSADLVSNCIIPIAMPFINFFIVLHSQSVLEAILNSMAIFFIIHIDEELYTRTAYENETEMKVYVKKVIATLYDYYTPTFNPNFSYEYETEHNKLFRLALQN